VPVTAQLRAGGGTMDFAGRATATGDAEGRLSADLPSTAAVLAALGMAGVNPPKGLGQAVRADGLVVVKAGKTLALRKATLRLDQNQLGGDVDVKFSGDRPHVTARLSAGDLDFAGLSGGDGGPGTDGWSSEVIDAGGLAAVNGQARITAKSVDLGTLKFGATDITMVLDRSRAVFSLTRLAGYGGGFGGEFVINNRNGLSVGGKLSATAVEVSALLSDLAGITRLSGKGDGAISFLGVGGSVDAIMKSLKGEGRIAMAGGKISGFDLDQLMRSGDGSGGTTIFDALAARFTMDKGNMVNDDLKMTLPGVEATGRGRIGLGARDIDYLFTPVALKGRKGKGLAFPVRIRGPWAAPRITPDLKAAIDLNLAEEKKALEDKIETKVKDKLSQELGVEVQEGENIEDALERKVEEELKKGLLKLLE
jgi:AsmA protein